MKSKKIHIKIADTGWILEKCAKEIASRGTNVTYGTSADYSADLQYYINYSARSERVSPVELAFFTHSEQDEAARNRYFQAAAEVDHCVCMSQRYADELVSAGHQKLSVIAPGVDLEEFKPKVRIGVIGRTYHTGRKGEALVAQVMDVPGIEWRFTGSGWPGPSTRVPEGRMADFYNDLDYVLVPARYEGGPMSVLEGLACGKPIISSRVGWVDEYPHIPFENDDPTSLRAVLTRLVDERNELRESVRDRSWSAWADGHLELFDRLLAQASTSVAVQSPRRSQLSATLITHGQESVTLGGPSVRVPKTIAALSKLGVRAAAPAANPNNDDESAIAHIFNLWPAKSCYSALERARARGKTTVLSPIFLNLSNLRLSSHVIPDLFRENRGERQVEQVLRELASQVSEEPNLPLREPVPGYHALVRTCMSMADGAVFLSDYERRCLEHIGAEPKSGALIRNPVDVAAFTQADPDLFRKRFELDDYILCVGRIEHRKNQLVLAHAAKTLGKRVVFIGHAGNESYAQLVRDAAGSFGTFISRIDPNDPLLKSAFAGASVFSLPSWAEGAPLAALEAAACGLPMVLSDRSSESEYFGNFAEYVNPADVDALRTALSHAAAQREDKARAQALIDHVRTQFSWEKYAAETATFYEKVVEQAGTRTTSVAPLSKANIYFDLTTSVHASGNPTGISRVETRALEALLDQHGDRVIPIAWNSNTRNFVALSRADALRGVKLGELDSMERSGTLKVLDPSFVKAPGWIVVLGGAWIRNPAYSQSLRALKLQTGLSLKLLVHDLIQMKLSYLYPDDAGAEFTRNAKLLAGIADSFLVYSDTTRKDLQAFLVSNDMLFKRIDKFRLGDMTNLHPTIDEAEPATPLQQRFSGKRFLIYVSSIESRKNHELLLNLWRRLIDERGSRAPHLILIGRPMWNGEKLVEMAERDPRLTSAVTFLRDVDDQDLDWFYRNCEMTLYPSLYEGWGLPVAESLSYGKLCLTSSTTSTAEVAPDLTDLLDPYDFRGWFDRITLYLDNPSLLEVREQKIRSDYSEVTWKESVGQIVSIVDQSRPSAPTLPTVHPGQSVTFFINGSPADGLELCAKGWSAPERTGRWSVGKESTLVFRPLSTSDVLHARLHLRAFSKPNQRRRINISIDNGTAQELELAGAATVVDLAIPVRKDADGVPVGTVISISPNELFSPQMVSSSGDSRLLGVQLISAQFAEDPAEFTAPEVPQAPTQAQTPAAPKDASGNPQALQQAREMVVLPARFTGKRPFARFARALGIDKIWLRLHARKFKRAYSSINLILDHLQASARR